MELKGCTLEELKVGSLTDCKVVRVMSGTISSRFPQGSVPGTTSFSIFITCPNNDVKSVPRWLGAGALTLRNGWESWTCSAWRRQGYRESKSSLRGGYKESRARLFTEVCGKRMRHHDHKLKVGKFQLYIRKKKSL